MTATGNNIPSLWLEHKKFTLELISTHPECTLMVAEEVLPPQVPTTYTEALLSLIPTLSMTNSVTATPTIKVSKQALTLYSSRLTGLLRM